MPLTNHKGPRSDCDWCPNLTFLSFKFSFLSDYFIMQFSTPTELISGLHFDCLLVPGSWVWCQLPTQSGRPLWHLGRIIDSNAVPGSLLVDVLMREEASPTLKIPTPQASSSKVETGLSDGLFVPRRMTISRSAVIPYDSAGCRNQGRLALVSQPKLSLAPALLDDMSFLFSSHPVSFAALLCDRLSQGILHTSVGPQVLISTNPFRSLPEDPDLMMRYWNYSTSQLEPHSLLVARTAYDRMKYSSKACPCQSIILLGPSGGGRAYTATRVVQFLSSRYSAKRPALGEEELLGQERTFVSQVDAATSILLSFTQVILMSY